MKEEYVKGYNIRLNEEEAEAMDYLKKNGWNIHKLLKSYIIEKANLQKKINSDRVEKLSNG
jgi:hypothetical protein